MSNILETDKNNAMQRAVNYLLHYMYAIKAGDLIPQTPEDLHEKSKILHDMNSFEIVNEEGVLEPVYFREPKDLYCYLAERKTSSEEWQRAFAKYPELKGRDGVKA